MCAESSLNALRPRIRLEQFDSPPRMIPKNQENMMGMPVAMGDWNACEEKLCYRLGGIAALILAIGYVTIIPLFAWVGAPPATGEAWFHYLPGKSTVWWVILWLSVVTDLLYLPVAWALWIALRKAKPYLMLAAVVCMHLFVVLDLAVTWTHHASLLALFQYYSNAADEAHRAAYLAAAEYAASIYATPLLTFYIIVIPSVGVLLASITMIKAGFGKVSAWTGVITGVFGLLSLTGFFPLVMANALGVTLWFFLVGARLLRLGNVDAEGNE
jgi:hypothetical protein